MKARERSSGEAEDGPGRRYSLRGTGRELLLVEEDGDEVAVAEGRDCWKKASLRASNASAVELGIG